MTPIELANGKWLLVFRSGEWFHVHIRNNRVTTVVSQQMCSAMSGYGIDMAQLRYMAEHTERLTPADDDEAEMVLLAIRQSDPTTLQGVLLRSSLHNLPDVYYAKLPPVKTAEQCTHETVIETRRRGFTHEAAESVDCENLRAHGGVEYIEVCLDCNSTRRVLCNNEDYEYGPWKTPLGETIVAGE